MTARYQPRHAPRGPDVTETALLRHITHACDERGLLWHHCADTRRCAGRRGIPDLIITGSRGFVFAELKSDAGERDAEQDAWAYTLITAGAAYRLWRPADWNTGVIGRTLDQLTNGGL